MRKITARYDSSCERCGGSITAGTEVWYQKEIGIWHTSCPHLLPERESSNCQRCGQPLTHPESRLRGYGPVCYGQTYIILDMGLSLEQKLRKLDEFFVKAKKEGFTAAQLERLKRIAEMLHSDAFQAGDRRERAAQEKARLASPEAFKNARLIVARYPGNCAICGGEIAIGHQIYYLNGRTAHQTCVTPDVKPEPISRGSITVGEPGVTILVAFDRADDRVDQLKNLVPADDRRYDRGAKAWVVKAYHGGAVRAQFPDLDVAPDVAQTIAVAVQTKQQKKAHEAAMAQASAAKNLEEIEDPDLERFRHKLKAMVPKGLEPLPFQEAGVYYGCQVGGRFLIGDEMGLGKTIQALLYLGLHQEARPALIVSPAAVKLNWQREGKKWLPNDTFAVLSGTRPGPLPKASIYVINYDIAWHWHDVLTQAGLEALVLDECQYLANSGTQRTLAVLGGTIKPTTKEREEARRAGVKLKPKEIPGIATGVKHIAATSGTPFMNRPIELWNIVHTLRPDVFGDWYKFATKYCGAYRDNFGWKFPNVVSPEAAAELQELLRKTCMIRRKKDEVLTELPEKQRAPVFLEVDGKVRREYAKAEADLIRWYEEKLEAIEAEYHRLLAEARLTHTDPDELARARDEAERLRNKMQAATRAEQLVKIEALKQLVLRGKMAGVVSWVEDFLATGEKLVLFAHHKEAVDELARVFAKYKPVLITGSQNSTQKQAAVDAFQQDPNVKLAICSIRAANMGITLTAASNTATIELLWGPGIHDQAEDRVHRIGQRNAVTAWYLLGEGTIEEDIAELIDDKRKTMNAVLNQGGDETADPGILDAVMDRLSLRYTARAAKAA